MPPEPRKRPLTTENTSPRSSSASSSPFRTSKRTPNLPQSHYPSRFAFPVPAMSSPPDQEVPNARLLGPYRAWEPPSQIELSDCEVHVARSWRGAAIGGKMSVDKVIGEGPHGRVFSAQLHTHPGIEYAVKFITATSPADLTKFSTEFHAQDRLAGPFVLPVIAMGIMSSRDGRRHRFLLMPRAAVTFDYLIKNLREVDQEPTKVERASFLQGGFRLWLANICEAIARAHKIGYAIGNVMPKNILVIKQGAHLVPHLADFDAVVHVAEHDGKSDLHGNPIKGGKFDVRRDDMQALARLACTILCPNLLEVLDDNASLAALEIDPSSLPPSCSWLPTFVLTAAKYYSTGTSIAFNGSNGLGAALQLKALIPLTNTTATSDPFLPTFPTPSNNIPRPPLPTPNSQSTSSRPLVAQPLAPTHSQNSTPAAPYPNSNREKRNIPRSSPASTSKDARRKARYAPPALQAIAEESVDREELEELSEERAEMEITTGDEEVQEFVQGSSRDLEINGPAVRPHRASTARPRRPNPPQPPRPRPRPLSTPPPPLPPPAAASAPPLPSSASSVAQLRRTRSAQPPNLKSLRPSLTADSSIALVEKEEEEEIEEVKSTSSDEEEQQRFERVGEVGSAASVVSVDLEGESAIGGEESGDAGSTASQEDDGSVDSEEQDEEEHACFLEKPLEMMPNKLFVSEKASLSEEVPSGWFKIYKQLGKGAFGVVFRAQHVDAPVRVYAMKVIKISTKKQRADLKRELDAQQDCDGKFTLPILGATTLSTPLGSSCIIMPVAVGSLAELFQHRDGLKSSNRNKSLLEHFHSLSLKWFTEICDGLAHIHDQGYAHRDLKPENIFFLARDGVLVPQIGDFGCAQFVEDGQDYGHAGTLPRSGPRHLFVSVRAQAANFIDDEVLLVESVHCAIERSQKLDTGRRSPFGEDVFGLMMLALDLFYTGPPTHFTRLSEIMTEIESDAISPEAFLEDAELHIRAHYKFMNLLVVKNKSTEAAETALPGAPAWLKAFFILAVVEGYRCDDIASFIGPQSVIRRLQGLVPLPSPSSRPPRDLSRLYPSGWTDSLPASQTGKALPLPRAPPTSNTSKTDSDDVEDDRAQSRLPSALAEEMAESLRKGLHRKWPIISRTELDLWINYINAHPEEANIYDREKAVEVGHESRARKDQRDVALFACAMPICSDRTGIGKNGVKKKGRPIKEAILHARISHGLRGGSFTC